MEVLSFIVSMGVYSLFLFLFLEYTREKTQFYVWFFIFALLSIPLWFINLEGFFRWAKSISILIPIVLVAFTRKAYKNNNQVATFLKGKWPLRIFAIILAVNILEATITDFQLGNPFNALCGVILIVTIPFSDKRWRIAPYDGKKQFNELLADLPLMWCILYTIWNAAFVYGENPSYFASSVCILTVPLIWMAVKRRKDLWLMGRVYTLAIHILIRSSYDIFSPVMNSTAWFSESVWLGWSLGNFILHSLYLVVWAIFLVKYKQEASKKLFAY